MIAMTNKMITVAEKLHSNPSRVVDHIVREHMLNHRFAVTGVVFRQPARFAEILAILDPIHPVTPAAAIAV
jgi:hypothetical protein